MKANETRPRRGRPRLPAAVRIRIVQVRAFDIDHPPSYDAILDQLVHEGWPLPSRGSVQNLVNEWERLPQDVRNRDLPYVWDRGERREEPWIEAHTAFACKVAFETHGQALRLDRMENQALSLLDLRAWEPFTNRWASWCKRVQLAAPDLEPAKVTILAEKYVRAQQLRDLAPDETEPGLGAFNAFLQYRPDLAAEASPEGPSRHRAEAYRRAIAAGVAPPLPDLQTDLADVLPILDLLLKEPPPTIAQAIDCAVKRQLLFRGKQAGVMVLDINGERPAIPQESPQLQDSI